jgi:hypothetical protein
VSIPVGTYTFDENEDVDYLYGWPKFLFLNSEFSGVDFLVADIDLGVADTLFAFTTATPLPTDSDVFDFSTFSVYSYSSATPYADFDLEDTLDLTEIITGQLSFEPVPEPSTLLLLGAGVLGALGITRRKS